MKQILWFLRNSAKRILAAALVGMLLLCMVFLLPTQPMQKHLDSSAALLTEETYPEVFPWCSSMLDNYTDALMLMHAANESGETPWNRAVMIYSSQMEGAETPVDSLRLHYGSGAEYDTTQIYPHYWHGYLLLLKPLLLVMDLGGIRILNAAVQVLMILAVLVLLVRRKLHGVILPFLVTYAFLMPVTLAMSLQFSSCFYLLTAGCIAVLCMDEAKMQPGAMLFLWLGIATAYFDYLTYPIAVFGIPAVLYCCRRGEMTPGETLKEGSLLLISWFVGYVGMWACKWLLGSVIVSRNILQVGMDKVVERSVLNGELAGSFLLNLRSGVTVNIKTFLRTPVTVLFLGEMAVCFGLWCFRRKHTFAGSLQHWLPYMILAVLPVAWYLAAANHSLIHYWFTNKALAVSVFAAQCALLPEREGKK